MKTSDLIKENNALREQLSSENKAFYEDLIILVRIKSLFRKEEVYEETLLIIVQDLLEAQAKGKSAQSYLGHDIYTLSDEIVAQTPKASIKTLFPLFLLAISSYLFVTLLPDIVLTIFSSNHVLQISLASLLVGVLLTLILIGLFFKSLALNRWILKLTHQKFLISWLQFLIPFALIIGIYVFFIYLTQNIWIISLHF